MHLLLQPATNIILIINKNIMALLICNMLLLLSTKMYFGTRKLKKFKITKPERLFITLASTGLSYEK